MQMAAAAGNAAALQLLISRGVSIADVAWDGSALLHLAANSEAATAGEAVELLLQTNTFKVDQRRTVSGTTCLLCFACR